MARIASKPTTVIAREPITCAPMPSVPHSHSLRRMSVEISAENAEKVVRPPRKPVVSIKRTSGDSSVWRVMSSIANPINKPPMRFAARVPSGSVGNTGLSAMLKPHRSHAPTAAPPPTTRTPIHENKLTPCRARGIDASSVCESTLSPHELIDVIRAEAACDVMVAAHVDLGEDVLVAVLPAFVVEIDHRAADVEEGDHLGAV